ncbi:HNH endonuclease [Azospirillum sp. A1-3]|uniref:HNH endonuclease signature motif containing protein n=1 Tax=Azospirillum sp. A1-3 TaxID=185874 RepID=UPI00207750CA|nr:HNH endonuclease signature motif containing protein [Azospirillum sp. A1-3]MCM8735974.1 HNH endonuclease [Azospirillum sp. A1-3]
MSELTQSRLKALLHYEPDTGAFKWLVATNNSVRVGQVAGCVGGHGYVQIRLDGRQYLAHRLAWLYMTGEWPDADLDHINRVKSDNRLANLREATRSKNMGNKSMSKNNSSGVKGVTWDKSRGKWQAKIMENGNNRFLGHFTDLDAAASAYASAAREYFGEFAHPAGDATQ